MKIGYGRVSTAAQNLELQLDALRAAGAERIFTETASGKATIRPELEKMIATLRPGDCVIVWRLDRLARSMRDLLDMSEQFTAGGIQLVSVTEGIDTTTTAGKLCFQIFGALAEFERNLIIERTHAGLAAAKARGRRGGRKPALTPDKQKAVTALLNAARRTGERPNMVSIARSVNVSERTVRRFAAK